MKYLWLQIKTQKICKIPMHKATDKIAAAGDT